ncbi:MULTISPECIES: hypothetical protein [Bacillus cereus group]|uniref:hypothetical protein n=1 Tax=Bacillus cereus group TaxID=86661 RepID=UPI000279EED7|nr:hypothetical protein [Bacillus cereus]EJR28507.1 hypothetical protein IIE_05346 [Bacillus cereus VD045]HDR4351232.1 hypothetical protein [Bacillus cereus]HDR6958287.1 hypothetical protein [Bacillus cereus]
MDKLIKEIMSSLDNKNYLSALALTLTLPDICGKIAYPEIKGYGAVGKRYAQWYNEYIHKFENPDGMKDVDRFDGDAVYKLRCNFLHDGSSDIREYMRGKYNQTESKDFVFELTDTITSYSKDWEDNEDDCNIRIQIGVIDFCRKMCWNAKNFYNKNSEQDIFNNIIISDDLYKVLRLNDSNKA